MTTLAEMKPIAIALKTIPGLDGAGVGNGWEGQTDQDLKVKIEARKGYKGFSVLWEYHDGRGELHQHRRDSVKTEEVSELIKTIRAHAANAFPGRFVESTEDPIVAAARASADVVEPDEGHTAGDRTDVGEHWDGSGTVDPVLATRAMWEAEQREKEEEERLMAGLREEEKRAQEAADLEQNRAESRLDPPDYEDGTGDVDPHVEETPGR